MYEEGQVIIQDGGEGRWGKDENALKIIFSVGVNMYRLKVTSY